MQGVEGLAQAGRSSGCLNGKVREMRNAIAVCDTMMRCLGGGERTLSVHSVFDRAMNFSSDLGMITLLAPDRCLMPFSVLLRERTDFRALANGRTFRMDRNGITVDGRTEIGFGTAAHTDLHLSETAFSGAFRKECAADAIRSFLSAHGDRGLTEIVFDRFESVYARFFRPRFERLRRAAEEDDEALTEAAYEAAGCGEGLTPSSDDLLCGYLLCASVARGRDAAKKAAYRASERTNDISAALLRRAGDGLFSKDVLSLIETLSGDGTAEETNEALKRVAAFGSSSGCDFLTGLYFGILDFTKGKEAM